MPKPIALSDQSLKHWGLLTQPFSHEFFFRSTSFKSLTQWLLNRVTEASPLHLIRSEIGAGVLTSLQQIASYGGIGHQAIDVELTPWTNQPLSRIMDDAMTRFGAESHLGTATRRDVVPIWLIHAFRPSQVTALRHRLNRDDNQLANVKTVIRIEDNPSTRSAFEDLPTFSFARAQSSELARAVARSMQCAGATRVIFDDAAIEQVVRISSGSFSELARVTNQSLNWGHCRRLSEITAQTVVECFGSEINIRRSYRRAAM